MKRQCVHIKMITHDGGHHGSVIECITNNSESASIFPHAARAHTLRIRVPLIENQTAISYLAYPIIVVKFVDVITTVPPKRCVEARDCPLCEVAHTQRNCNTELKK